MWCKEPTNMYEYETEQKLSLGQAIDIMYDPYMSVQQESQDMITREIIQNYEHNN